MKKETKHNPGKIQIKSLTQEGLRKIVSDSVFETLKGLGFDTSSVPELQADMYYLRKLRKGGDDVRALIRRSALTVVVSSLLYLLWQAVGEKIRKGL